MVKTVKYLFTYLRVLCFFNSGVNANTVKPERVCIVQTSTDECPAKESPKLGPSVDEEYNAYEGE